MNTLTIDLPDSLEINGFDLKMILASKLFDEGKLSSGQAAKLAGVSKQVFLELLGKYEVSMFGYGIDELEDDLKNV